MYIGEGNVEVGIFYYITREHVEHGDRGVVYYNLSEIFTFKIQK